MAPSDLTGALRRAANQAGGPRGRAPSQRLLAAADVGLLTRNNTVPGTAGRRAVDRGAYLRRRAAGTTLPAREALGHRVTGSRPKVVTFYTTDPARRITLEGGGITQRDVRRGGAYLYSVRTLIGDLRRHPRDAAHLKREWERRAARRAPIATYPFLATADAAIALADQDRQSGEEPTFDSGRSRPGRRRRRPSPRRRR